MSLPPSPAQRERAIAWLRSRVPTSDDAWRRLNRQHQQQSLRIAGVSTAQVLGSVLRAADKAVANGTSFEAFKRAVGAGLRKEWAGTVANPTARMETIFINITSTALNRGRWEQMNRPEALKRRPFFAFVAVEDGRLSPICRRCRGVILPASHPFWKGHCPPLHHRCRSCLRALSVAQARERGVAARAPQVQAQEGFGEAPFKAWTPDERRVHPLLQRAWRVRLKEYEKRAA